MRSFLEMTEEEKAAIKAKATASRAAKQAHAAAHLRHDFLDADEWLRLATVYGVRLPQWADTCEPVPMRAWLKRLRLSEGDVGRVTDFAKLNPAWPIRAYVGLLLEERRDRDARVAGGRS